MLLYGMAFLNFIRRKRNFHPTRCTEAPGLIAVLTGAPAVDARPANLGGEHRAKPVPPVSYGLVADLETTLVQKVLDVSERQREADLEHHRKSDDLWPRFKVAQGERLVIP